MYRLKKLLALLLALGIAAPLLQAKSQEHYEGIIASCKALPQADALKELQALPVADQRIVLNMIAKGLADNPKELEMYLPLALSVHANDSARSHRRGAIGFGVVAAATFTASIHRANTVRIDDLVRTLDLIGYASSALCAERLLKIMFHSTPAPLANHTFTSLLKNAQG